jgi:hypothetical protein
MTDCPDHGLAKLRPTLQIDLPTIAGAGKKDAESGDQTEMQRASRRPPLAGIKSRGVKGLYLVVGPNGSRRWLYR